MMRQRAGLEKLGELHTPVVEAEQALAEAQQAAALAEERLAEVRKTFYDAACAATDPDLPYRERILIAPLARQIGVPRQTLQSRLAAHREAGDAAGPCGHETA